MSPSHLPSSTRIPVPARRRWQLLSTRLLPVLVFAIVTGVCAQLWHTRIAVPSFIAQVEQRTATVRASVSGEFQAAPTLASLQRVSAGDILGWVQPVSSSIATAELTILRRELDALQSNSNISFDLRRVELESSRLQLEWMQARVDLTDLQAQLRAARDTVQRLDRLQASGAVPTQQHELALAAFQGLEQSVATQTEAVTRLTPVLDPLYDSPNALPDADAALRDSLAVQEARLHVLELRLAPRPLLAPINGVVLDHRASGERLLDGETVATIGADSAYLIIGYERQPVSLDLTSGDQVTVRSRRLPSRSAVAVLLDVSPTLEPVPPDVLGLWRSTLPESGRRYQFSVPLDLALLPGELVEISLSAP